MNWPARATQALALSPTDTQRGLACGPSAYGSRGGAASGRSVRFDANSTRATALRSSGDSRSRSPRSLRNRTISASGGRGCGISWRPSSCAWGSWVASTSPSSRRTAGFTSGGRGTEPKARDWLPLIDRMSRLAQQLGCSPARQAPHPAPGTGSRGGDGDPHRVTERTRPVRGCGPDPPRPRSPVCKWAVPRREACERPNSRS